ncbi:MAG: LacI family transcriptional regulator [Erysipelotrichaceae bacterium]|jgi:LacI family sucrose operon transcriptional repressor|nr:LacI family transcriptional regulator [Erysipelotrichaceae bacterium]
MARVTINDIAKYAEVGKSTVSRYFNGGYVKEETRNKIEKVCREYNYQPNYVAKSLKAKHSYQIGVITPSITSRTASRVLTALDEELRQSGYTPILINTNHNRNRELQSLDSFTRMNVEGVILLATEITKAHKELIQRMNVPVVVLAQKMSGTVNVTFDDYHAGYDVGMKIGKTSKHPCLVMVSKYDKAVGVDRRKGILDGLAERKVKDIDIIETDFSFDTSRQAVQDYLAEHVPDAMICATDNIALAAFKEIHRKGYAIPKDISLISFGGYTVSQVLTPSLCTVKFDYELEGRTGADLILDMIMGKTVKSVRIGYEVLEGESVK